MDVASKQLVYLDRFNRVDFNVLEDRLESVYKHWKLDMMKIEANSIGQPVIDHLYNRDMNIIPFMTTSATKQPLITNLQSAFEHSEIGIINDAILIGELCHHLKASGHRPDHSVIQRRTGYMMTVLCRLLWHGIVYGMTLVSYCLGRRRIYD